jgi:hyperosmotically inducible protein
MRKRSSTILTAAILALTGIAGAVTLDEAATNLKVRTVLLEKFGTDALGIHIDVQGGRVVLTGAVDKTETKAGAKAAASAVKGVTTVDERLTLGNGPGTKTHEAAAQAKRNLENALLEARVKGRLFEQVGENALKISVTAREGVVTVKGALPTNPIRATARDTARSTRGVVRLVDELTVG